MARSKQSGGARRRRGATPSRGPSAHAAPIGSPEGSTGGGATARSGDGRGSPPSPAQSPANGSSGSPSKMAGTRPRKRSFDDMDTLVGVTRAGRHFTVPPTSDTLTMLMSPRQWPTLVAWFFFALTIRCALPGSLFGVPVLDAVGLEPYPAETALYISLFWRLAYNGFLGMLLRVQSKYELITRIVAALKPGSLAHRLVHSTVERMLPENHRKDARRGAGGSRGKDHLDYARREEGEDLPDEFVAWVLLRYVVNVVLPNDALAFVVAAIRYMDLRFDCEITLARALGFAPLICDTLTVLTYALGIVLVYGSLYGKRSAHKTIGQYAWFWGDFFYLVESELTFDGIFNLFPHPMYSVGYGWMYGVALVSRSYTVLALALLSHLLQFAFLALVETPHIDKTYGSDDLRDPSRFTDDNIGLLFSFDAFRAADWSLVLVTALMWLAADLSARADVPFITERAYVINAAVWVTAMRLITGAVLHFQDKTKFWTKHYMTKGAAEPTRAELETAFAEWKRVCNLLNVIRTSSFLMAAFYTYEAPSEDEYAEHYLFAGQLGAAMLIMMSVWTFYSSYTQLGDFGWFDGDFFMFRGSTLSYNGVYRFLNNPTTVMGCLWMFGVAILCRSLDLGAVAVLAQVLEILFTQLIEEPHMRKTYERNLRRESTPLQVAIESKVKSITSRSKAALMARLRMTEY